MIHGFEPWPAWCRRPVGIVLRVLIGLGGTLIGGLLILLADFGASYMSQSGPEWNGEYLAVLVAGLAVIGASLWVTFKPCRITLAVLVMVIAGTFLTGAII